MSANLEQVGIDFQAIGAQSFNRDITANELALRQQAKAFDLAAASIKAEIIELKNAESPNKQLIQSKRELLEQTKASASETRASIQAIKDQGLAYDGATRSVQQHKGILASIGSAISGAVTQTLKLVGTVSSLVGAYDLLKKVSGSTGQSSIFSKIFDGVNVAIDKTKGFISDALNSFSGLGGGIKNLAGPATVAVGAFGAIGAAALAMGLAIGAATAGIGLIIGAVQGITGFFPDAVGKAREFEVAMRTVSTAMTGTVDDVKKLGDNLLDLSTKLDVPAVELAAAQYEILSAGISDTGLAFQTLEESAKLAKAGLGTVQESANLLTGAINAFGVGPVEAANILFKTIQDGKTTAAGLSQSFGLVAGGAQSAGVSFIELNAATAALTLTTQTASTAQTGLRAAVDNITQPSEEAKKVAKALGIEFNGAALQSKGLAKFLVDLKAKVGENKSALGQLFGSTEAYNAVVKLTGVSLKDFNRILLDLKNSSGSLDEAFNKQRDNIHTLTNLINNELIKAGRNILTAFAPVLNQVVDLFIKAGGAGKQFLAAIQDVLGEVVRFAAGITRLVLGFVGLDTALLDGANGLKVFASFLDIVNTAGEATAHVLASITKAAFALATVDFKAAFDAVKDVPSYLGKKANDLRGRIQSRVLGYKGPEAPAPGLPVTPPQGTDPRKNKEIDVSKQKTDGAEKADRQRVQDIERKFQHQLQQLRDQAELAIKQKGPFVSEGDTLAAKLQEEQASAEKLRAELVALNAVQTKTPDGSRALKEAVEKTTDALAKQSVAVQDAQNALTKFTADTGENNFKRQSDLKLGAIQFELEQETKAQDEQAQTEATTYAQRKITIDDYYKGVLSHIQSKSIAEEDAYQKANALIEQQIELLKTLKGFDETRPEIKDLRAQQSKLYLSNENAQSNLTSERDVAIQQRQQDLQEASRNFAKSLEGDISTALQNAFSGQNPLNVVKEFGKSLYKTVVQSLTDAVAAGFAQSQIFKDISGNVGDLINKLSIRTGSASSGGQQSGGGIGNAVRSFFSGGKTTVANDITGNKGVPFINATGGQGVPFVAQSGSGASSLISTVSAAALPIGIALASAQNAIAKGGGLAQKYVNFIDPLNFRKLLGFGGSSKAEKQAKRDDYHQNVLAPFLNNVVSNANPDNLTDLNASFLQAARGKKGNGSSGQKLIQQAMQQILDLIAQRQKAIDDFIKTSKQQNEDLADNIRLADAGPFEQAKLEREIALKQIKRDTDALLEQYKDSEAAKTEILATESLKRQQLDQQEKEKFKSDTQDLATLLRERDSAANSNVYTRATSAEQQKANTISDLDKQIAEKVLAIQGEIAAGTTGNSLNSNQILNQVRSLTNQTNTLQVTINAAEDPNAINEQITRAFQDFTSKIYGANA